MNSRHMMEASSQRQIGRIGERVVIDVEATRDSSNLAVSLVNPPPDENYVIFSNIDELLDSI